MKTLITLLFTMLVCSPVLAGDGQVQKSRRPVPNQYLVQFEDFVESPRKEAREIARHFGVKLRYVYKHGVKGFAIVASPEQAAEISEDARVEHVEEDGSVTVLQVAPVSPPGWALDRINQRTLPLDHSANTGCNSGSGVTAYVLDTGVNGNSTEFGTRLTNGFTVDSGDFSDEYGGNGHGTAVASIIGGATYGVARSVKLVNVKVVSPIHTSAGDLIAGLDWVIANHQATPTVPKVANISLLYPASTLLDNKVIQAIQSGITVVVGAGNTGGDTCLAGSPARLGRPNNPPYNSSSVSTITVTATKLPSPYSMDEKPLNANRGPCVDLFAPGEGVDALTQGGVKGSFSGTSFASPYVAGSVARHLHNSVNSPPFPSPAATEDTVKYWATPVDIVNTGPPTPEILLYLPTARCRPS